jgi:hypothetical protein
VREQEPRFSFLGRCHLGLASGFPHYIFYCSGSLHRRAGLEFVPLFYHLTQSLLTDSGQSTCRKVGATHTPALIRFHWRFVFPAFRSTRASGLVLLVAFLSPVPCFRSIQRAGEYLHSPPCSSSIRGVDSLRLREGFCPETLLLARSSYVWCRSLPPVFWLPVSSARCLLRTICKVFPVSAVFH